MKYHARSVNPQITDCIPESEHEHELMCKAFPYLMPFQYITVMGDGGIVFKEILAVMIAEREL